MNKITFIASALLLIVTEAIAQKEFKLVKTSGKLVINNISNLKVEGYDGKEIIFSSTIEREEKEVKDDPRAAGLTALSNSGFDNTGIGISIVEKENNTIVSAIERELGLTVKLPQGVALSIKTTGFGQKDSTVISLSNIKTEIDASTQYEHFNLKNITGPISLKTLYGNIEGKLTPTFKGPISLVSVYGFIDVTVPESTKANLSINTQYETLYAAKDLRLVMDEAPTKSTYDLTSLISKTKNAAEDIQRIIIDGNTVATAPKVKGTATTETITTTTPAKVSGVGVTTITSNSTSAKDKPTQGNKKMTVVSDNFSYAFSTDSPVFFNSSNFGRGTVVNGKLNGGGEKIVLKSTYGKIYLRK